MEVVQQQQHEHYGVLGNAAPAECRIAGGGNAGSPDGRNVEIVETDADLNADVVLDVLAELTHKSLLLADETDNGSECFGMLEGARLCTSETIHTWSGRGQLSSRPPRRLLCGGGRVPHPDPIGPPSNETPEEIVAAITWADAEYHNIQSALAWWLDSDEPAPGTWLARLLNRFWQARGFDAEAYCWLAAFFSLAERTGSKTRPISR
jgi:hypothetical protein